MLKKYKTLFFVKSSLISLYLALTIPIPLFSSENIKIVSIITFVLGLIFIIDITNDYVETCDNKISYKTGFFSKLLGKQSWEIAWNDIKIIKSLPTSQGSKVYYFVTSKSKNFLIPQRIEKFDEFISMISRKTGLELKGVKYISPLWTYRLLTYISLFMIIGEVISFSI